MESMNESLSDQQLPTEPVEGAIWSRYVTSLGAILLVTWPLLSYGIIDTERARWQHAAARVAWEQGDREKALEVLNRAVELDPGNIGALADRAFWQGELGEHEKSRQDLQAMVERVSSLEQEIQLRQQLCDALLHLDRPDEVIRQWEIIGETVAGYGGQENWHRQQRILFLNNRAYQVALTGQQLKRVIEEADQAIALLGGEGIAWDYNGAPNYLAACQAYLEKYHAEALVFSSQATRHARRFLDSWERQFEPRTNWKTSERKRRDEQLETMRRYVARVYKLHAMVLEKIGQVGKRDEALAVIRELGQQPDQLEGVIGTLDEIRLLMSLQGTSDLRATVLDTRGFALLKNQQPNLALMDLLVAVRLCDARWHEMTVSIDQERNLAVDPAPHDRHEQQMTRQLAVLLYHRSLAYEAVHQPARAREDLERVRKLGFTPGIDLF
jgi:tetratricopeptide (TPR) repeat protein